MDKTKRTLIKRQVGGFILAGVALVCQEEVVSSVEKVGEIERSGERGIVEVTIDGRACLQA
jgi:hypothetical protein